MANPNPPLDNLRPFKPKGEKAAGRVIGTRYDLDVEEELDKLPDKQGFIKQSVRASLQANKLPPRSPNQGKHPETDLQTLATLNPKECSFKLGKQVCTGTIAAVLVDWTTGKVSAVLVNTADSQVQVPIANVTILPD